MEYFDLTRVIHGRLKERLSGRSDEESGKNTTTMCDPRKEGSATRGRSNPFPSLAQIEAELTQVVDFGSDSLKARII